MVGMNDAAIGIIGTLSGTLLGFVLSTIDNRWREQRTERRQAQSVRLLVGLEIQQNLESLERLLEGIPHLDTNPSKKVESPKDIDQLHYSYAYRIAQKRLLVWIHNAWESQMAMLPIALKPREIQQVQNFHQKLRDISSIHSSLINLLLQEEEDRKTALSLPSSANATQKFNATQAMTRGVFVKNASKVGEELEATVQDALKNGTTLIKNFSN